MGISIQEFKTAMEVLGATRLSDQRGTRYDFIVPSFRVRGIQFIHSGSYYVVSRGAYHIPSEILTQAMAEFGEEYPGKDNFWWGEIHSIKGMLTLSLMLQERYSKELLDKLTNETYKKLFDDCTLIQSNVEMPFKGLQSSKFQELYKTIQEYDSIVNPFGNDKSTLKEPIEYLDKVNVDISFDGQKDSYASLCLKKNNFKLCFDVDSNSWSYRVHYRNKIKKGKFKGYTSISHYYNNGEYNRPLDEVIYLGLKINNNFQKNPEDIDLRISLKTGLAWKTYHEKEAKIATDDQIKIMLMYLKKSIEKIKNEMIDFMIN